MRILHFADVHLDRPLVGLPPDVGRRRRHELRVTFRRCLTAAREQKADLVTIGGDLWEDEHVTPDTRRFVASELKDLSLPVLMICGNHDPYLAGGNYARSVWPDNVRICQRDQLTEFQFGPVSVWAVSWLGGRLEMGFLDTLSFERGEIVLGKRTISNLQGRIATSVSFCQSRPVFCSLRQSRLRRFSCCAGRRLRRCLAISISS